MARSFNGTTDKIDLTGTIVDIAGTNPRSISAWSNPTSVAIGADIFSYGTGSNDLFCALEISNNASGDLAMRFIGENVHTTTTPVTTGLWQHLLATWDGTATSTTSVLLYYNGIQQASAHGGVINSPNTDNSHFGIGYDRQNNASFYPGVIADVAVWNTPLTALEALALSAGVRPSVIRPNALRGWWPLDGLASPEVDLSGAANTGTVTGTALAFGPPVAMFTPRWAQQLMIPPTSPAMTLWAQSCV